MFERSGDVKKGLGLGKRERIRRWFREWVPYVEYEIGNDLNVHVKGHMFLTGSQVTQLPEGLSVGGSLFLGMSNVFELPENLNVKESLSLCHSHVIYLPTGLSVGRSIYMNRNQDIEVPENLKNKIRYR
jgi:hypothetical protein